MHNNACSEQRPAPTCTNQQHVWIVQHSLHRNLSTACIVIADRGCDPFLAATCPRLHMRVHAPMHFRTLSCLQVCLTITLACAVVSCHALVAVAILLWLLRLTICNHLQLCETARVDVPQFLICMYALIAPCICTHLQGKTWQATPGGQLPTPPAVPVSNDSRFFRVVEDVNGVSWFRRDTQLGECALAPIKRRSRHRARQHE
jgi:hypothetical protein